MIYLDYSATTPLDKDVLKGMEKYLTEDFGNANSVYSLGRKAMAAIDSARDGIAGLLGVKSREIYFTSGGSEGDSWVLSSVAENYKDRGRHIILSSIEHHAVLNAAKELEKEGFEVTYLPVNGDSIVEEADLKKAMRQGTVLVGIMYANNETGSVQNIPALSKIAKAGGALFFCDAVQAVGKIPLDLKNVDFMTFSAHKFYGPKGVGGVYAKDGVRLSPLIFGGEQERGKRGGTTNTAGVVGMYLALRKCYDTMAAEEKKIGDIRNHFVSRVLKEIPDTRLNGKNLLFSSANITFSGVRGQALLIKLDLSGVAASLGAACASGSIGASHVLKAMGMSDEEALSSLRFSFGRFSTLSEADETVEILKKAVGKLRIEN